MIKVFSTCKSRNDRLARLKDLAFGAEEDFKQASVSIDSAKKFQEIEGFGGAFTEAASWTLDQMPKEQRERAIEAYFNAESGLGYTLCRTHINSCDFALGNYAYVEKDGDFELKTFDISRDRKSLLPLIKDALKLNPELKIFASPWSPPAWMKTTGKMNNGGKLRPECRQAWANYYCRYIKEYAAEGVDIWGLTVQNEPEATQTWDSCIYTGDEERDFVRDHLGPALEKAGLSDVKLMIWDHNRDRIFERAKAVYDDPKAAKYVWGTAYHWYCGDHFENLEATHQAFPDKKLFFSEGCQEGGPHLGEWETGERYARNMIQDFKHWAVAWTDWNLVLDQTGGPNHVRNLCSAPILCDINDGTLQFQNSYYYIGHLAKFVKPGAKRILCSSTKDEMESVAFVNPDESIVGVVLNRTEKDIPFLLKSKGKAASALSRARSINTYLFKD